MSEKTLQVKHEKVSEILDKVKRAKGITLVDYRGISVADDTKLRNEFRKEKVEYRVLKNRLLLRALNEAGLTGMDKVLEGPTAVAFSYDDATTSARVTCDNLKKIPKLLVKAGIVEGKILNAAETVAVSAIPPFNVLVAQLLGLLTNPMRSLAVAVSEVAKQRA
ncbi:MAG: 50S ribosomal protein L10 [Firmicutes bacterium]|nr:50S ribosomal protein L10 [Bacillota bacterium]